jgi:hypothetical protein
MPGRAASAVPSTRSTTTKPTRPGMPGGSVLEHTLLGSLHCNRSTHGMTNKNKLGLVWKQMRCQSHTVTSQSFGAEVIISGNSCSMTPTVIGNYTACALRSQSLLIVSSRKTAARAQVKAEYPAP